MLPNGSSKAKWFPHTFWVGCFVCFFGVFYYLYYAWVKKKPVLIALTWVPPKLMEKNLLRGHPHLWEENNWAKIEVPVLARRWQRSQATLCTGLCANLAKTQIQTKAKQQSPAPPSPCKNKRMKPLIIFLLVFILIARLPEIWLYEIMHAHQADEFP